MRKAICSLLCGAVVLISLATPTMAQSGHAPMVYEGYIDNVKVVEIYAPPRDSGASMYWVLSPRYARLSAQKGKTLNIVPSRDRRFTSEENSRSHVEFPTGSRYIRVAANR